MDKTLSPLSAETGGDPAILRWMESQKSYRDVLLFLQTDVPVFDTWEKLCEDEQLAQRIQEFILQSPEGHPRMNQAILIAYHFRFESDLLEQFKKENIRKKLTSCLFKRVRDDIMRGGVHVRREWLHWLTELLLLMDADTGALISDPELLQKLLFHVDEISAYQQNDYFCRLVKFLVAITTLGQLIPRLIALLVDNRHTAASLGQGLILLINNYQYMENDESRDTQSVTQAVDILLSVFESESLHDYFYVNDLRVLLDIILRHLQDLPEFQQLRHRFLTCLSALCGQLKDAEYRHSDVEKCMQDQILHARATMQQLERHLGRSMSPEQKHQLDFARTTLRLAGKIVAANK